MLKSTLNSPKPSEPKRPTLPHLFKATDSPMVVLFTDETEGFVVIGNEFISFGEDPSGWPSCWDETAWTPLRSGEFVTITVESED